MPTCAGSHLIRTFLCARVCLYLSLTALTNALFEFVLALCSIASVEYLLSERMWSLSPSEELRVKMSRATPMAKSSPMLFVPFLIATEALMWFVLFVAPGVGPDVFVVSWGLGASLFFAWRGGSK